MGHAGFQGGRREIVESGADRKCRGTEKMRRPTGDHREEVYGPRDVMGLRTR